MFVALWFALLWLIVCSNAQFADIPISRVSNGYFSDPYHVPYQQASKLHIAGTTHEYLVCDNGDLTAGCAHSQPNDFRNGSLGQAATNANVQICGAAGIHPFQSNDGSWDALVTLHVAKVRIETAQPRLLFRNHAEHCDLDRRQLQERQGKLGRHCARTSRITATRPSAFILDRRQGYDWLFPRKRRCQLRWQVLPNSW